MGQMGGPISVYPNHPGGVSSLLNITAAAVVKSSPGVLVRLAVSAPGTTSGSLTINDSNANIGNNTITAITQAASAVVTVSTGGGSNPFAIGNTITFASVTGMTQINGLVGTVTAIGGVTTAWTITVNINSSAFSAYVSGGTCSSFGVGNQIYTAGFAALSAGLIVQLSWPCSNGILVSAVPTAGSPVYALSYF